MLDDEPASEDEEAPHVPDQPSEPTWLPSRRVRSKRGPLPFDQRPDGSIFGPAPVSEYGGDSVFPPAHEVPLPDDDEELGNTEGLAYPRRDGSIPSDGPLLASTPGVLSRGASSVMDDGAPPPGLVMSPQQMVTPNLLMALKPKSLTPSELGLKMPSSSSSTTLELWMKLSSAM